MKHTDVRLWAVILALALTGCGGRERAADAPAPAPAPDLSRLQDLVPLTTAKAARLADRIALVEAGASRVIEGAPGTPFTRTTFSVQDVVKGRLPHRFVVQTIGGRIGDEVVESPMPAFVPTRRYVVFLGPDGPAGPTIFPQSVLEIRHAGDADRMLASIRRALRR